MIKQFEKFEVGKTYTHGPFRFTLISRTARTGIFRDERGNELKAKIIGTKWECNECALLEKCALQAVHILNK